MVITMKSVALYNLGCKVNSYELDVIQQILQENGYKIVPFDEKADIYIVNTCTVTNIADRKSRQMLHRAKKINPEAVVVAAGCYVQAGNLEDAAVDLVIGNRQKQNLVPILEEYLDSRDKLIEKVKSACHGEFDNRVASVNQVDSIYQGGSVYSENIALTKTAAHTRAYIKIQDGCNQFCSYCIIPFVRGRVKSRGMREILAEAEGLVRNGYREIVLTGIHISSYGLDFDTSEAYTHDRLAGLHRSCKHGPHGHQYNGSEAYMEKAGLLDLMEKLHEIPELNRIRLGSLEPRIITPEFAGRVAKLDKVCPHFHLSLQSGCDDTLERMNRHYTTAEYFQKITLLREAYAGSRPAFTTDIIVGFPGETEAEFEKTKYFLRKISFSEMHVFKYSQRDGTKAAAMKEQIAEECKKQRSEELIALNRIMKREYRESFKGKEVQVLLEESKEIGGSRYFVGHTGEYVKAALKAGDGSGNMGDLSLKGELREGLVKGFLTPDILLI